MTFLQFATCGCDGLIKIWQGNSSSSVQHVSVLEGHEDKVIDVQWRNAENDLIASAGDDMLVHIWTPLGNNEWDKTIIAQFNTHIAKLSWEENGNSLAVITNDGLISLYRESGDGIWNILGQTSPDGEIENKQ